MKKPFTGNLHDEQMEKLRVRTKNTHLLMEQSGKKYSYSILIPVYKPVPVFFREALLSACRQTSSNIEILLGFDGEQPKELYGIVEDIKKLGISSDKNIRIIELDRNVNGGGISNTTNALYKEAVNEYIIFMDHDDWIRSDLIFRYEQTLRMQKTPGNVVLFCNEFKIDEKNYEKYGSYLWKPEKPPFPYVLVNYICHCLCMHRNLFKKAGMLRSECDGAQDFDLVLRLDAAGAEFRNVPFFLYAWRSHLNSTAINIGSKSYISENGIKALQNYSKIKGLNWDIEESFFPTVYRVKPGIEGIPKIQVIVPFKDQKALTIKAVKSAMSQDGVDVFVTAIDHNSKDKSISEYLKKIDAEVLFDDGPFNFSRLNNLAVKKTKKAKNCNYILFLNNDVELLDGALLEMARWAAQPNIGMVGAKLFYPDADTDDDSEKNLRVQHCGVDYPDSKVSPYYTKVRVPVFPGLDLGTKGFSGIQRPVDIVTAACALIKKDLFLELGGFDEINYPISYSDVDLCRKVYEKGYYCFYTPYAKGIHYESVSRGKFAVEDVEESKWLAEQVSRFRQFTH